MTVGKMRWTFVLTVLLALAACSDKESETVVAKISGRVAEINSYGQVVPDFTPEDMKKAGFDYADLINATIGDDTKVENVPFLTSFNESGVLELSYVDYNAKGTDYGFGLLNGDFHKFVGGKVGDKVVMTLAKKGGYKKNYDLLRSVYPEERRANETAEQYANFRMITTSGMAEGVIYRSSNPLNCVNNACRYRVADSLARVVGIKTEIDLADTEEKVEKYMATEGYESEYCPQLFRAGNTITCGMSAAIFDDAFKAKMGQIVKFMIAHEPPYLVHCNEGKDRCGFVSMLFEALQGASAEELRDDYMETMLNFYQIEKGGESYRLRQTIAIDRMIWVLCNEESLANYKEIRWDDIDVLAIKSDELQAAARNYLSECGVSDQECDTLMNILAGKKTVTDAAGTH